ncbi:MAG: hypothetical protein Q4D96_08350 [Propionibacteriaceae bacterium]|nr:hypothetical protein [Propionibacteriaceae bacterium]
MSKEFYLRRAARPLRELQDELGRQGTPFIELERREGVDLWPRYAAWSCIGRILAEYDGSEWVLSLALPGADFFATCNDWLTYHHGQRAWGYGASEGASANWLRELLVSGQVPQIDVGELDRIVESRSSDPHPSMWQGLLVAFGVLACLAVLVVGKILTNSAVATIALISALAAVFAGLGTAWRISRWRKKQRKFGASDES